MRCWMIVGLAATLLMAPAMALAHSGGTDANGCHGGSVPRHCHSPGGGSGEANPLLFIGVFGGLCALSALLLWIGLRDMTASAPPRPLGKPDDPPRRDERSQPPRPDPRDPTMSLDLDSDGDGVWLLMKGKW